MSTLASSSRRLPSVHEVLRTSLAVEAQQRFGRMASVAVIRSVLADARVKRTALSDANEVAAAAVAALEAQAKPNLQPVFNLTGTVLHTNLGRALLADAAVEAATVAMHNAVALEFDLGAGRRGDRDELIRDVLCELTGAEDATVVNNNAAAVLLVVHTLARRKEAIVSRGELIEIGGAFRMPEVMSCAGAKLIEVGTTNRTHKKDYLGAICAKTGLILKVHTSNYRIEGFTKEVGVAELSTIARQNDVPLINDLGSGTLVDLARFDLAREPTVREAVEDGSDLVTFSGDKLLGGPQAGFIVGRKDLIARVKRNPMKRALRIDKVRLAALEATLALYRDPDRLADLLPTLRLIARRKTDIVALARRLMPVVANKLGDAFEVSVANCASQIGSGALPLETMASAGLSIKPRDDRHSGHTLSKLSAAMRALPIPVVARIEQGAFILDLRCLEAEEAFCRNLTTLDLSPIGAADKAKPPNVKKRLAISDR